MSLEDILVGRLAQSVSAEVIKHLKASAQPVIQPALLSVKDAAIYLGRSEQSIQHLIADRVLPVIRHGRRVHLWRNDLDKWIESNRE